LIKVFSQSPGNHLFAELKFEVVEEGLVKATAKVDYCKMADANRPTTEKTVQTHEFTLGAGEKVGEKVELSSSTGTGMKAFSLKEWIPYAMGLACSAASN
jgi:hypothetical protein